MSQENRLNNYKDISNLKFINGVAFADKDGTTVAITENGIVFDKKYAEILRVINNNPYLVFDVPNHIIVEPELIYAIFNVIESKIKELFQKEENHLDLMQEVAKFQNDINKFLKQKQTLLKVNLPKFEYDASENLQKEKQ